MIAILFCVAKYGMECYKNQTDFCWPYCSMDNIGLYVFLGLSGLLLIFLWICLLFVILHDFIFRRKASPNNSISTSFTPFYTDFPSSEDARKRSDVMEVLIEKIGATTPKLHSGSFAILLDEAYGEGKTSFLLQFETQLHSICPQVKCAWFKPWLFDTMDGMSANLLQIIAEQSGDNEWNFRQQIHRYAQTISDSTGNLWTSIISVLSERKSAEEQYKSICDILKKRQTQVVIIVDDVDRLELDELVAFLKLIRNTASFPYLTYVVAGDKRALVKQLRISGIEDPEIYLRKFFNFEMLFPAEENGVVDELYYSLQAACALYFPQHLQEVEVAIDSIRKLEYLPLYLPTLRDVKRYANIVLFELEQLHRSGLLETEIRIDDLLMLLLLQYVDVEVYRLLRDHPLRLLTSEGRQLKLCLEAMEILTSRDFDKSFSNLLNNPIGRDEPIEKRKINKDNLIGDEFRATLRRLGPTDAERVEAILSHLFNGRVKHDGIGMVGEFYKYFSNRYRESEISDGEIDLLLSVADESSLEKLLSEYAQRKKINSLTYKLNLYLQVNYYDVVQALKNLYQIFSRIKAESNLPDVYGRFFENYVNHIFRRINNDDEIIKKITGCFQNFAHLDFCVDVLVALRDFSEHNDDFRPLFFSENDYSQWCETVQHRYLNEYFIGEQYADRTLLYYRRVRELHEHNFVQMQYESMKSMPDVGGFFYRMIIMGDDKWIWNQKYCQLICEWPVTWSNCTPPYFDLLSNKIKEDLIVLGEDAYKDRLLTKDHPFVKAAAMWWKRHPEEDKLWQVKRMKSNN